MEILQSKSIQPIRHSQPLNTEISHKQLTAQTVHLVHPVPPHWPYLATVHPPGADGAVVFGGATLVVFSVVLGLAVDDDFGGALLTGGEPPDPPPVLHALPAVLAEPPL